MSDPPCPTCGSDLTFIEQHQRYFCSHCRQYTPEGYGMGPGERCPKCGGLLCYVAQYDRSYCYRCNSYAPLKTGPTEPLEGPKLGSPPTPPSRAEDLPPAFAAEIDSFAEESSATSQARPTQSEPSKEKPKDRGPRGKPERPALSRRLIEDARKSELIDLCKAYDLDPTGTKEQMRERLLSFLDEADRKAKGPEPPALHETKRSERAAKPPAIEGPEKIILEAVPKEGKGKAASPLLVVETHTRAPSPSAGKGPAPAISLEDRVVAPEPKRKPVVPVPPVPPRRIEHPCGTCGRELDYIRQYDRWYCYSCKAYAPLRPFRHVCPTCGATLRWIPQYARWWCDAERRYARADLPPPSARPAGAAPTLRR